MSAFLPVSHLETPAALAAFLRGVERRGAVLAELQCGDARAGDAALVAAMRGFRAAAATLPMADWPVVFWARVLAQPQLRHRTALALALDATDNLAELGSGPRVALLLRLAAGLGEADAAAVLGVAEPAYRLALRRALPHHDDGSADPEAWQRLSDQVQRRVKTLPQDRLLRLTRAREAALLGEPAVSTPTTPAATASAPRWLLPVLWTLLMLCVGAFAATFWRPDPAPWSAEDMRVRRRALPPAEAPAARYGRDGGLIAHGDFALLTDPLAEANTRDLDFYSWLAAQQATAAGAIDPALAVTQDAASVPATAATAAHDADAAAETHDAPH